MTRERLSRPLLITFALIAMAYLLPRCWWYYSDSVAYSALIQHGGWREWLHPHHLLLCPLILGCWKLTAPFGFAWHPLDVWRWIGVFTAVATLWLMIRALRAAGFSDRWTIFAILTIASCWYTWLFSTTPTHYALVLPWLMVIFLELQRWNSPESARKPSTQMVLALTVAVMLHQLAILVVIPILGWMVWLARRDHETCAPWRATASLLWPSVCLYLIGGIIVTGSIAPYELFQWATSYGHVPRYWWWGTIPPGVEPVDHWLALHARSYRDLLWALPADTPRALASHMTRLDEPALAARLWWQSVNPHLTTILNIVLSCLSLWTILCIAGLWRRGGTLRDSLILALLWCAPFVLFHAFYSVQDGWFRLYYLLPLTWILTAPIVFATDRTWREIGTTLWALLLAFTFANNIANGYSVWRHREFNRWLTDLPLIQKLDGWLVFDQPGFYYYNSVYPWAFTDRIVYQAEVVKWEDVPRDAVEAPTVMPNDQFSEPVNDPMRVPADFYLDSDILEAVPKLSRSEYVLHLGWAMPNQNSPKELWIPLESMLPASQPQTGIYDLEHFTYVSWNPKFRKAVMPAP